MSESQSVKRNQVFKWGWIVIGVITTAFSFGISYSAMSSRVEWLEKENEMNVTRLNRLESMQIDLATIKNDVKWIIEKEKMGK